MRTEPPSASTARSSDPFALAAPDRAAVSRRIGAALQDARAALDRCVEAGKAAGGAELHDRLRTLAGEIAAVARPNRNDPWVAEVQRLFEAFLRSGGHDVPVDGAAQTAARTWSARGWNGAMAAMLVAPAWQVPDAPLLDDVPDWLWRAYAAWLFQTPTRRASPPADTLVLHQARHLRAVDRWSARNAGSASLRAAVASFLAGARDLEAEASPRVWFELAQLRGRVMSRQRGRSPTAALPALPRHGRRLRVGFVVRSLGPGPDLYELLPCFEELDSRSFEVFLFPLEASAAPEAAHAARRALETHVLPGTAAERLAFLQTGQLDVLVFACDPARAGDGVAELALNRIAPLQVALHRAGGTSGLPEIDLIVLAGEPGDDRPASAFTERCGVLRGPAHSLAFAASPAPVTAQRADVGLPAEGPLLVAVVDDHGAPESLLKAWIAVLERVPAAHLAVAVLHEGPDVSLALFCASVDAVLAKAGVESRRVTIFPAAEARPDEVRGLLALGDLSLDAGVPRRAGWLAVESLRAGVPVLTVAGRATEAPAAYLRALELADCIAAGPRELERLAAELAADDGARGALRARVEAAMEAGPEFLDTLAASDAFGALLEAGFDELCSLGHAEFRRQAEVVRCFGLDDPAETLDAGFSALARGDVDSAALEAGLALRSLPADLRVRHLVGLVLQAQGHAARAVDYLLGAVQRPGANGDHWLALARALRENRQPSEAIQALESCLRLDPRNLEALFLLLELSEAVGATDMARDVLHCLREVAPDDPRVVAMS